jgi:hypothetical protein
MPFSYHPPGSSPPDRELGSPSKLHFSYAISVRFTASRLTVLTKIFGLVVSTYPKYEN